MLYEVMQHIRNYFPTNTSESGLFTIVDNTISLSFVPEDAYIRIGGSLFNDGIYKYPVTNLKDETFEGEITVLAPPKAFLELVAEIEEYTAKDKGTPYVSESFGGYSYTKATTKSGNIASWQSAFGTRLNAWRKI